MLQVIIANNLADGFVVFLSDNNSWTTDIAAAAVAATEAEAEMLLAGAKQAEAGNVVIDPYLTPIEIDNGVRKPTVYREYIRATGPTVPIPT